MATRNPDPNNPAGSQPFDLDEDAYWQRTYQSRPYYRSGAQYDDYRPAYQYGWESAHRYRGRQWNDVESDLRRDWESRHGSSGSTWEKVKDAVLDAWNRLVGTEPGHGDEPRRPGEMRGSI